MSLRLRLILLTVALVTVVVVVLSGLYLNSLVDSLSATALDRAQLASQQVNAYLNDRINRNSPDSQSTDKQTRDKQQAPASFDETKELWRAIVASDPEVAAMLFRTMALSAALAEIDVAGQDGVVLASSNPSRVGQAQARLENFADWRNRSLYRRLTDLIVRRPDYQVVVTLGVEQQPIFSIQVVTSSVFLLDPILPQVKTVAEVAAGALLVSLLLAGFATSRALRPLKRIEETIDRIAQGNFSGDEGRRPQNESREFAALESKLNLLGQKYSGAREDNTNLKRSLDDKIASVASQFDVASRLAAISRISGGVAHEIKNPLNAIALRLDLLRAHAEGQDGDMIPEIDVLSKEVRRLDRVVKTFLDFSRPLEVRFAEVDLGALVGEVANLMTPQAKLAGVEMHFEAPAEPALIRGDADLLKQTLLNLVTNALEVMKNGGHLRLKVERAGDFVVAEVADDGPGIPPEVRDKVFQLYFTTKERGSGIGLALTYRAVQLHNGTVDFTSEIGRGTTFRLQFPALVHHV
jgi:signal transduction histidine kinase